MNQKVMKVIKSNCRESAPKWPRMSGIWMLETERSLGISNCVSQEKLARGEPIEDSGYGY